MKPCFDGNSIKQSTHPSIKKLNGSIKAKSLYVIALLILIGSVAIFWGLKDVNAQTPQTSSTFKVIVQIVNNGNLDEHGTLHVVMDGSRAPQVLNNEIFPGLQTTSYTFEFSSAEAPVGKGFTAEVIYGDDEHKRAYGSNTPANTPETVSITIP
ncbi:MAG: hypothetical protein DA329_06945 [Candidatus Nitrosocosmicus sp.]|jgi:hypothetical protein|uniref:hypothetical protein n=1 Tax=Candidatus Nitrosocosmicus sp. FF01 TaxID=3397670 RepID=UPI002A6DB69C|nr:hypothetical protein [Candidatus Nitrosocosmicus sp.]